MLTLLHIENIAVIEEADIQFASGFHALTGETGAGKSIVIDALGAVLGQRTSRDLIRTGAAKAFVSAAFAGVPAELPALAENGIAPEDGELLLSRYSPNNGNPIQAIQSFLSFLFSFRVTSSSLYRPFDCVIRRPSLV